MSSQNLLVALWQDYTLCHRYAEKVYALNDPNL